jgi:peptidoglycan/LPS O-acetylase OafA/YrhL
MLVGLGAAVLLGPEAVQAAQPDALAGPHLVRLLVGGVAALLVGIGVRSRVLVVAGSIAVVLAALRALFLVLETVQPYLLFGAIALLLLVGAAVLAGLRERVGGARSALATSWADWN